MSLSSLQNCCKSEYLRRVFGPVKWDMVCLLLKSEDLAILVFSFVPDDTVASYKSKVICNLNNWWSLTVYWCATSYDETSTKWVVERTDRFELSAWFWNTANSLNNTFRRLQYQMVSDLVRDGKVRLVQITSISIIVENITVPIVDIEYEHHDHYWNNEDTSTEED